MVSARGCCPERQTDLQIYAHMNKLSNVKPTVIRVYFPKSTHISKAVNLDDQTCEPVHWFRIVVLKSVVFVIIMDGRLSESVRGTFIWLPAPSKPTVREMRQHPSPKTTNRPHSHRKDTLPSPRCPRSHLQPCSFTFAFSLRGIYPSSAILRTHSSSPAGISDWLLILREKGKAKGKTKAFCFFLTGLAANECTEWVG